MAASLAAGSHAADKRRWPKATPPPPPSSVFHDVDEPALNEEEIERMAAENTARLRFEIEQAFAAADKDRIEAVLVFLLPELLQEDPQRAVDMVAKMKPGAARDRLRGALARQWVVSDVPATIAWIRTLDGTERKDATRAAIDEMRPIDPVQANVLVRELGAGRADEASERVSAR